MAGDPLPAERRRPAAGGTGEPGAPRPGMAVRSPGTALAGGVAAADGATAPGGAMAAGPVPTGEGVLDGLAQPGADATAHARPEPRTLPRGATTRFAPAPTGYLHLGHLVNALYTWGIARATGGRVILRIEDHDRQRSRSAFETALLDDLERLGLVPDEPAVADLRAGPSAYRQSDVPERYAAALATLRAAGRAYACDCARSTFATWAAANGSPWHGPGCPGRCAERTIPEETTGAGIRVALGGGTEAWDDLLVGPCEEEVARSGDPLARDRHGNWTYGFCVVVDDLQHRVGLVIRGRDLLHATPAQLRLARLLGRERAPGFLHHPLVRKASGAKLSKADGDTAVRALLDAGWSPAALFGMAARLVGLQADDSPLGPDGLARFFV
jgi:glutamyl-Q tRNA(Asp) synthetase